MGYGRVRQETYLTCTQVLGIGTRYGHAYPTPGYGYPCYIVGDSCFVSVGCRSLLKMTAGWWTAKIVDMLHFPLNDYMH